MAAHWEQIEEDAPQGGIVAPALLELRARVEALEAARTPDPTPPPVRGVTVEELAELLVRLPFGNAAQTHYLLNHPRIGPLLRGEGRRVELPEEPVSGNAAYNLARARDRGCWLSGWAAARAALARQQGEEA